MSYGYWHLIQDNRVAQFGRVLASSAKCRWFKSNLCYQFNLSLEPKRKITPLILVSRGRSISSLVLTLSSLNSVECSLDSPDRLVPSAPRWSTLIRWDSLGLNSWIDVADNHTNSGILAQVMCRKCSAETVINAGFMRVNGDPQTMSRG